FHDVFRSGAFPFSLDADAGGSNDGSGAIANNGTYTVHEYSKPLASGDAKDFNLAPGSTVGFRLLLQISNASVTAGTELPAFSGSAGDIVITDTDPLNHLIAAVNALVIHA